MNPTLRQVTVAGVAVAALAASFTAGAISMGPDRTAPSGRSGDLLAAGKAGEGGIAGPRLTGALDSAESCDELLDWYVAQGVERVTPWGWDVGGGVVYDVMPGRAELGSGTAAAAPKADEATSSDTGTNVQEAGVDEADAVKTDGTTLIRVDGDRLTTYDVGGERPARLASVPLPDLLDPEALLIDDMVVVLGSEDKPVPQWRDRWSSSAGTRMIRVDIGDPAAPSVVDERVFSSRVVSATEVAGVVRLTLSEDLPDLDFVQPWRWRGDRQSLKRNEAVVRASTIDDWLPSVERSDGSSEPLMDCEDIAIPDDESGLGTLSVVAIDPGDPESATSSGIATDSTIAYTSSDHLVLATSPGSACCWTDWTRRDIAPRAEGVTRLHAFAIDGLTTSYAGSGEVEGQVADRWAIDEADGVIRIAVGATSATGNFNSVVTLRIADPAESDRALTEIGRVDKLGVNEQIKSVRWFDDLAVLVTFRQIDPLYAVDLSDPASPKTLGELKLPGYSEYLHPIGSDRMLGIGIDATAQGVVRGAQAGLFDLTDPTTPRRVDAVGLGKQASPMAGQDPRQFTWLPDRRTALTVLTRGYSGAGMVAVLEVDGDRLETRMTEVEYGSDISRVRLVPLPGSGVGSAVDRVVLVAGEEVSFFPLGSR
ncbi:MAG: beta-propeller domain-containing protein [Nocardioides sp.]